MSITSIQDLLSRDSPPSLELMIINCYPSFRNGDFVKFYIDSVGYGCLYRFLVSLFSLDDAPLPISKHSRFHRGLASDVVLNKVIRRVFTIKWCSLLSDYNYNNNYRVTTKGCPGSEWSHAAHMPVESACSHIHISTLSGIGY